MDGVLRPSPAPYHTRPNPGPKAREDNSCELPAPQSSTLARMAEPYASTTEIDALVAAFNTAEIPPEAWNHRRHLTYAADVVYACADFVISLATIRAGIHKFNALSGITSTATTGYHETVTHFWTRKIVDLLDPDDDRLAFVNRVVDHLGSGALVFEHYRHDTLMSPAARAAYVAPDLRPL